jgi:POT family proton-dependent oligopeptide transporter
MPLLPPDELQKAKAGRVERKPLDRDEWRAVVALLVLFLPNTLFWATYEQQGNTIALWADANTDRTVNSSLGQPKYRRRGSRPSIPS